VAEFPRRSGILLHPTSLPGRFGIGDLGEAAYRFVDFLAAAGQTYWQVLPLGPTGYGDSPYQGTSALGGNPLLVSLDRLVELGHLSETDLEAGPSFREGWAAYPEATTYKTAMLEKAYRNFGRRRRSREAKAWARFCEEHADWLDDLALFMALKDAFGLQAWTEWNVDIATRRPESVVCWEDALADAVESHKYRQWCFFEQWSDLKRYANERGVLIIGDLPIFVSLDSVDVWANHHLFDFADALRPATISGVPPDYFSPTGQLWGHPHYRWDTLREDGYAWWIARFRMLFQQADVIRIDHFRGFFNYWEIPNGSETAIDGQWVRGPGSDLFRAVTKALGEVAIIAEDLGELDEEALAGVAAIQDEFCYPGMRVLQFGFGT
jgi:4-alpha-glucanotransferase